MNTLSLNGAWTLNIPGTEYMNVSANVPGSVYHDLLANALIPDPFYRDNEDAALKLMENDFHYNRAFFVDEKLLASESVILQCNGLDTLAELSLNGTVIGTANNMQTILIITLQNGKTYAGDACSLMTTRPSVKHCKTILHE